MTQENAHTENQFEVEKKLQLTMIQSVKLIESFDLIKQIQLSDTYWKDSGLHLPLRDRWLRKRGDNWELKNPVSSFDATTRTTDKYNEITDTEDIKQILGVMGVSGDFEQDLREFEYSPWFTISSVRNICNSKRFPGITIVHDVTDFDYVIWEVEKCVEKQEDVSAAEDEIIKFISNKGITLQGYVRGKVHEYLYRYKNEEFQELARAGIMK